jgi:hypothetical protein
MKRNRFASITFARALAKPFVAVKENVYGD